MSAFRRLVAIALLVAAFPVFAHGTVEEVRIDSRHLHGPRTARVYLPPDYDAARRYPLLIAVSADFYFNLRELPEWLDAHMDGALRPALVVGVDPESIEESLPDRDEGARFKRFVIEEVVPEIERRYTTGGSRELRGALGFSSGANVAVDLAVQAPALFGRVAAQSPGWMYGAEDWKRQIDFTAAAIGNVKAMDVAQPPRFWFVWGDESGIDVPGGIWEARSRVNGELFVRELRKRGIEPQTSIVTGTHGVQLYADTVRPAFEFLLTE